MSSGESQTNVLKLSGTNAKLQDLTMESHGPSPPGKTNYVESENGTLETGDIHMVSGEVSAMMSHHHHQLD